MTAQAILVTMPRLSDSMEEGTVIRWLKDDMDHVALGDELVEIETDKAVMIYEAESEGALHRLAAEGETLALGQPLAELLPAGVSPSERPTASVAVAAAPDEQLQAVAPAAAVSAVTNGAVPQAGDRVPATPIARRLAAANAIDLASLLPGSGPRQRITKRDIERALASGGFASRPSVAAGLASSNGHGRGDVQIEELSRVQATIARRMVESRSAVPDFSVEVDVDSDALVALRASLKAQLPEGAAIPSYNDFVVKAAAITLRAHPRVNGAFVDGHVERYGRVNVAVAVATDGGLFVPVVGDADIKSIGAIATETRGLSERARKGEVTPQEVSSGTFTVSNLGMFGVSRFTAVVNQPQAAILAVGALEKRPTVRNDEIVVGHSMTLTLCSDHRIIYGADAARFLADIRVALENPLRLLA